MGLPSFSKIGLAAEHCAYAFSSAAPKWPTDVKSDFAKFGDDVHDGLRLELLCQPRSLNSDPKVELCVTQGLQAFSEIVGSDGELLHAERKLIYAPRTNQARWDDSEGQRLYRKFYGEFGGTPDFVAKRSDGSIFVGDWKTGVGARDTSAADTWQLRILALAIAKICNVDTVTVGLVHLEPGDYYVDSATFDCFDLDEFRSRILELFDKLEKTAVEPNPGPWCTKMYCPIVTVCPATKVALARVEENLQRKLPVLGPIVDGPDLVSRRTGVELLEKLLKEEKARQREWLALNGAIELENGKHLGLVETQKEYIDLTVDGAEEIARQVAPNEIEVSITKKAIEDACKLKQTKRGEGTAAAREVFDKLREIGAMKVSTYSSVSEFKRKD